MVVSDGSASLESVVAASDGVAWSSVDVASADFGVVDLLAFEAVESFGFLLSSSLSAFELLFSTASVVLPASLLGLVVFVVEELSLDFPSPSLKLWQKLIALSSPMGIFVVELPRSILSSKKTFVLS